jgi:hypothetical protein
MFKSMLFALPTLLAASVVNAAPIACPTGTAATYTSTVNAAGGCTEDGLLFSQFAYTSTSSGTALSLPASGVAISPLLNALGTGFGFQIAGGFGATSGGVADGTLQYEVSTLDSSPSLNQLSLTSNGTATGTGIAGVSENYCVGGMAVPLTTCSSGLKNVSVQSTASSSKLENTASFAGTSSVTVSKDIQVNGGTSGTATISLVSNQFKTGTSGVPSSVPEPGTFWLGGGALLLGGILRRAMHRATS